GLSVIVICSHPIAVEYWPLLYRYGKQQWQGTKNKWNDWWVVVEHYRQGSPEQFWATFTVNGAHMPYTTIVQKLHDIRMAVDSRLAEQAHREFGATFDAHFTYQRGGQEYVMMKVSAIAKGTLS
ncbi:hypothetical protein BDR07DRAFT_1307841, partial [Suillus spraguei]